MTVLEHPGLSDIGKWFDLQVRPQQLHPVVDSVSGSSHSGMSVSSLGSSMSGSSLLSSMPAVPSPPIMMPQGQTFQPFLPAPAPAPASQILPQETRVSAAVTLSFLTNFVYTRGSAQICVYTVGISTNCKSLFITVGVMKCTESRRILFHRIVVDCSITAMSV